MCVKLILKRRLSEEIVKIVNGVPQLYFQDGCLFASTIGLNFFQCSMFVRWQTNLPAAVTSTKNVSLVQQNSGFLMLMMMLNASQVQAREHL